jgi:hypothetical protein
MSKKTKKQIKLLRLTSGEEIIAEISHELNHTVVVYNAIIMIPAGQGKIGFMPWMPYTSAKDGLVLKKQDIMFMIDPIQDLIDQFKSARSGIVTPPQGMIL